MSIWRRIVLLAVVGVMLLANGSGASAGGNWRSVPIWTIDGAQVDLGFFYDDECVAGPIKVEIQYPKGVSILLIEQDTPPFGYDWTTTPRGDFKAGSRHIDLRVIAVIPSTGAEACKGRGVAGVRITPLDDRFNADADKGRYDTELVVRS